MARAKPFFPSGLKFNVASVKNNNNNEKSILNVSLDAWCATSPAVQQHRTQQYLGFAFAGRKINIPGPSVAEVVNDLCEMLYKYIKGTVELKIPGKSFIR